MHLYFLFFSKLIICIIIIIIITSLSCLNQYDKRVRSKVI